METPGWHTTVPRIVLPNPDSDVYMELLRTLVYIYSTRRGDYKADPMTRISMCMPSHMR